MAFISMLIIASLSFLLIVLSGLLWKKTIGPLALREERLPLEEIYKEYFADLDVEFSDFLLYWEDISNIFCVVPETIRPSDRFGIELPWRMVFGSNDEDILLSSRFFDRAKQQGFQGEAHPPKLNNVRDYILGLSRLRIRENRNQGIRTLG